MNVTEIPQAEKKYILADILKKRNHEQSLGEERTRKIQEKRLNQKQKKPEYVGPEVFVKKYRKQQLAYSHLKIKVSPISVYYFPKRTSLKKTTALNKKQSSDTLFDIPLNITLVVVRIRGIDDISEQQKKIFQWLRIKRINTAVFVKSTPKVIKFLKLIENYVAFGVPSRSIISQLLMKRAHVVKDKQVVQLTGNDMIEQELGSKNIICYEDLIEEIQRTGENFFLVSKFLQLNHPKNQLKSGRVKKPYRNGGEWGYRESKINELLELMI